jgi:phage-related protein
LGDNRLFYCTFTGRRFVILHGYRKKGQKAPEQDIATAERRMADFFDGEARKR